jgi:hypothetical protein
MSSKFPGVRKLPSFDTDELRDNYDIELGILELESQLKEIESDKRKETYERKKEAYRLRQAIKQLEKNKSMSYEDYMKVLSDNSIPVSSLTTRYIDRNVDLESGKTTFGPVLDPTFNLSSPSNYLRRRTVTTPELNGSSSPFIPISSGTSRSNTPLPTTEEVVKKKSVCEECIEGICPEGCNVSGGVIRRRRKIKKTRKVRKSRKSKNSKRKSKRKI